jgi:WD40 repeat protein
MSFISSTLEITIPEFNEKYINGKTITFYIINVTDNYSKEKWTLEKRYSEIDNLYKTLLKILPNIPSIPGKTLFKITDFNQLQQRRIQLENFLKLCSKRKDITTNESFKQFLELNKHSPQLTFNPPEKIFELKELPLGVRDFIFFEEEKLIYIICSDMNIASRVDAYISNVNLPWEKKTDSHITVGAIFTFKIKENKNENNDKNDNNNKNNISYEKIWVKSFPEQTGVISFEKKSYTLLIGLDMGNIIIYRTNERSNFLKYEEISNKKPHYGRVMGIGYDYERGYIYSCSSDKRFVVSEINFNNETTITETLAGYTNLIYDKKNERVFLTNEAGVISIFLTKNFPPNLVNAIQTNSFNCIRGLEINYIKQYIFTATNKGNISILDLGNVGKEKLIKEISYFGGNIEIRIIRYNSIKNELYTGDQNGKITIWSLKKGESVYAWQAHNDAITQMYIDEENNILISGGKDKKIIYWKLPENWINSDLEKFEDEEMRKINDEKAILKFQNFKDDNDSDSSDDSLNGWDIRP